MHRECLQMINAEYITQLLLYQVKDFYTHICKTLFANNQKISSLFGFHNYGNCPGDRKYLYFHHLDLCYIICQNVWNDLSNQCLVPPDRVHLHSTSFDHLVDGTKVLHLLPKFFQLSRRDVGLQLCLNENVTDLIVLSTSSSPVAKIVVTLDSGEGDVAEFDGWVLARESSESGKLTCREGGDESLKGVLDLVGPVLLMGIGHFESLGNSHSCGLQVLDGGKALIKFSHHDFIILIQNFPMNLYLTHYTTQSFYQEKQIPLGKTNCKGFII